MTRNPKRVFTLLPPPTTVQTLLFFCAACNNCATDTPINSNFVLNTLYLSLCRVIFLTDAELVLTAAHYLPCYMATFENLFNHTILSVCTPRASLGLPAQDDTLDAWAEWLGHLEEEDIDRKTAFFGKVYNARSISSPSNPCSTGE